MSQIDHPRHPLLRTWLFGPGADSAAHDAMSASGANVLILDLEDSTPPPLRDKARALAAGLFGRWRMAGARVCVRINSLHEDGPLDLASVIPAKPDFIAYPKAATASDMRELDRAITALEQQSGLAPGSIGILPVCETALGVVNLREIAAASPRIRHALLGAEDLAADLMAERSREAVELDYARRRFAHRQDADAARRQAGLLFERGDGAIQFAHVTGRRRLRVGDEVGLGRDHRRKVQRPVLVQ